MKKLLILLLFPLLSLAQPNGIKTDSTGLQTGIEIAIPPDTNIAIPYKRTAELLSMVFDNNLNVMLNIRINNYTLSGEPMLEAIAKTDSLTADQKEYLSRLFASYTLPPASTQGAMIDLATYQVLVGDTLPGHSYAPELYVYQNLTGAQLQVLGVAGAATETRPMQQVYKFIPFSMLTILKRKKLIK